jgi:hypothetical protein
MAKGTVARRQPPASDPPDFGSIGWRAAICEVGDELPEIARRLRTIARILYDDVGEALAGCEESDVVYPYFTVMLDAIRTEATRLEKQSEELFAYLKAVA